MPPTSSLGGRLRKAGASVPWLGPSVPAPPGEGDGEASTAAREGAQPQKQHGGAGREASYLLPEGGGKPAPRSCSLAAWEEPGAGPGRGERDEPGLEGEGGSGHAEAKDGGPPRPWQRAAQTVPWGSSHGACWAEGSWPAPWPRGFHTPAWTARRHGKAQQSGPGWVGRSRQEPQTSAGCREDGHCTHRSWTPHGAFTPWSPPLRCPPQMEPRSRLGRTGHGYAQGSTARSEELGAERRRACWHRPDSGERWQGKHLTYWLWAD